MRVALVHDYIKEYGGAERVLEALHELYPDAPVFTTVYLPEFLGPHRERFNPPAGGWDIQTSWFQNVPFKAKLISPLRLLAPFLFQQFNFSEFDVVIVSATGAYNPNVIKLKSQNSNLKTIFQSSKLKNDEPITNNREPVHICYCHTPPRYLYGYQTAREWKKNPVMNVIGTIANYFLRKIDVQSSKNVDYFIANSQEVAGRIKKFYKRDAKVIYPPIDINSKFEIRNSKLKKNEFFLAGGRLARPKNIDLIIRACRELNVPLKIFGKAFAGYGEELKAIGGSNVEFLGEVTDEEKFELMKNAKAYIFAAIDEDFGITPVEAMSVGTPVIAYRGGGLLESVVEGKTGVFFDELSVKALVQTIQQFNNITIDSRDCIKQAQKFSKSRFKKEIKEFVENTIKK